LSIVFTDFAIWPEMHIPTPKFPFFFRLNLILDIIFLPQRPPQRTSLLKTPKRVLGPHSSYSVKWYRVRGSRSVWLNVVYPLITELLCYWSVMVARYSVDLAECKHEQKMVVVMTADDCFSLYAELQLLIRLWLGFQFGLALLLRQSKVGVHLPVENTWLWLNKSPDSHRHWWKWWIMALIFTLFLLSMFVTRYGLLSHVWPITLLFWTFSLDFWTFSM